MRPYFSPRQIEFHTIGFCFFLSGFAALLYQTVWLRQFGIYFGTSEQAIAVVLSAYMGGLALGSWLAAKYVDSLRRPVLVYGLLELGIAIGAMLVPIGFMASQSLYLTLIGQQPELPSAGGTGQIVLQIFAAFGIILIPTTLMGATLPVLTRHAVTRDDEIGPGVGLLYAENTAGAVLGTLVGAFVLMPRIGLWETTTIGMIANACVFAIVLVLARTWPEQLDTPLAAKPADGPLTEAAASNQYIAHTKKRRPSRIPSRNQSHLSSKDSQAPDGLPDLGIVRGNAMLPLMLVSGAVSFSYEVLCTRMLGHMLGGSIYAFATMLASFLLGIAVGGGIAAKLATSRQRAIRIFILAQIGAALCGLAMYESVDQLAGLTLQSDTPISLLTSVSIAVVALFPTALFIGMTFPVAIRTVAKNEQHASVAAAQVYSWNTLGAILGSLSTGFFVLPIMHYSGTATLAILASLSIAAMACFLWRPQAGYSGFVAASLLFCFLFRPSTPVNLLWASSLGGSVSRGPIVFSKVGRSATVTVNYAAGALMLRTNGLPEAGIKLPGSLLRDDSDSVWLGALASLLRPSAESMLVVGFGGGSVLEHIPKTVQTIDVCELEPVVIEANRLIGPERRSDPLKDRRVRVVINDARSALRTTSCTYDAIVSQPSHPWTAGASHLYTQEFAEIAHQHLNSNGVFVQWIDQSFVDDDLLRSMSATLLGVYRHVRLYRPTSSTLLFAASDEPIEPEIFEAENGRLLQQHQQFYRAIGLQSTESLLAILAADHEALVKMSAGAPPITDNRNLLAMRSAIVSRVDGRASTSKLLEQFNPLRPEISSLTSKLPEVDWAYVIRRRIYILRGDGWQLAELLSDAAREECFALQSFMKSKLAEAKQHIEKSLQLEPNRENALFLRVQILSNEGVPDSELDPLISNLPEPSRSTAAALKAIRNHDYATLQKLDSQLALATPRLFCFETASQLRVQWRLQDSSAEQQEYRAEALQLLDTLLPYTKDLNTLSMRFIVAMLLHRDSEAIGTCEEIAYKVSTAIASPEKAGIQVKPEELLSLVTRTLGVVGNLQQNPANANFRLFSLQTELESLRSKLK